MQFCLNLRARFSLEVSSITAICVFIAAMLVIISAPLAAPWLVLTTMMCAAREEQSDVRQALILAIQLSFILCAATAVSVFVPQKIGQAIIAGIAIIATGQQLLMRAQNKMRVIFFFTTFILGLFCPSVNELKFQILAIFSAATICMLANYFLGQRRFATKLQLALPPLLSTAHDYLLAIIDTILMEKGANLTLEQAQKKMINQMANTYPEWIFAIGFNPALRSGIRYFMLMLDRFISGLSALNALSLREINRELVREIAPELQTIMQKNSELLLALKQYFLTNTPSEIPLNLTQDVGLLDKKLKKMLPTHLELLDVSPDYLTLIAIGRELKEERQWLLQLLYALPNDGRY